MKDKTFFIDDACRPTDFLCSGTEELERNDLSVWLDYFQWFEMALTDEILEEIKKEEKNALHDRNMQKMQ